MEQSRQVSVEQPMAQDALPSEVKTSLLAASKGIEDGLRRLATTVGKSRHSFQEFISFIAERVDARDAETWLKRRKRATGKVLEFEQGIRTSETRFSLRGALN